MISNKNEIKKAVTKFLRDAINDKVLGLVTIKISLTGNREPEEFIIEKFVSKIVKDHNFLVHDISVIADSDGFSRLFVKVYDTRTIVEYIKYQDSKIKTMKTPKNYINAMSKLIAIADDFNNQYGEGDKNRTKEIQECEEIFQLLNS